jgi:hypothetical protein
MVEHIVSAELCGWINLLLKQEGKKKKMKGIIVPKQFEGLSSSLYKKISSSFSQKNIL